jgi:DNA-binding transcriptional LysR family regulator
MQPIVRTLARRGTITAVAEALSYSPSAVSQQLAALEKETGVRLLEPAGRRVRLTAQADLLVAHTEVLLEEMERAEAALAQSLNETVGTLRVAAFQTAVLALVPHALSQLERQHPSLRVEVTELEPEVALPALVAGEFDLILGEEYPGFPLPHPRETERHDLLTDELRLITPARWSERSLPSLASRPFVMEPSAPPPGNGRRRCAGKLGSSPTRAIPLLTCRFTCDLWKAAFTTVRRGAARHPKVQAFTTALKDPRATPWSTSLESCPEPGTTPSPAPSPRRR